MVFQRIKSAYQTFINRVKIAMLIVLGGFVVLAVAIIFAPRDPYSPGANYSSPIISKSTQLVEQPKTDPKPSRTRVDAHTRKDGTKVKGHWRKVD